MTDHAVFSDIFTTRTFEDLSDDLKSLFLVQQCNQSCCSLYGSQIVKKPSIIVLYITCANLRSTAFENYVSEAVLPNSSALYCDWCQKQSGVVTLPTL